MQEQFKKRGVHFNLRQHNKPMIENVIWFANWAIPLWDGKEYHDPPCYTEELPETWHEGYHWRDLNIIPEVIYDRYGTGVNRKSLFEFIRAFIHPCPNGIFMHVFNSRLP